jgi:membrane protease YdiL (CAAX protease family)
VTPVQRRIIVFFIVSYPLTWWGFALVWLFPSQTWAGTNFALGPLIAAPIVIWASEGRDGLMRWLRRIARFRAPVWVYTAAFFVPLGIAALSTVLAIAIGTPVGPVPTYGLGDLVFAAAIVFIMGPFPEEVSFRGFGQHELQTEISPFAASLWIGLGVVIWHLPLFISGEDPWLIAVTVMAVSVVYAWLYCSGGSVWPMVIVHFTHNYFGAGFFQEMFAGGDRMPFVVILTIFYLAWVALIVWRVGPSLGLQHQPA